ncbi:hypothetical protein [Virgisporangium aurantiacum]|uniref:Uncharacterized protein n=1 Tax=Virgisporangium aurantiacum TaxID=175570 RepID=A0A8J4E9M8_9ACTN|nr:hypothetical protein [Virgisporangium aurantiacum]GIJ63897.1 hypothetical protein Vau01_114130 [Virgisporangium aurantiacum]
MCDQAKISEAQQKAKDQGYGFRGPTFSLVNGTPREFDNIDELLDFLNEKIQKDRDEEAKAKGPSGR